ncbi:MAG TPA: PAS domain S-box protein, partial [Phycisphaerae bacterium]|nr:PAS domain S-box protein [Phycisphaerae bacterium]
MLTAGEGPKGSETISTSESSGGMDRELDAKAHAGDQALRESEERYRTLAESMPFIVWQSEPGGASMYANPFFHEFTGWTAEDLRVRDWTQLVHQEDREEAQQRFASSLRGNSPLSATLRLRRRDGTFRWFKFSGTPVRVPGEGERTRWVGTGMDVDEEIQTKRELSRMRDDLALQVAGLKRLHELGMRLGAIRDLPPSLDAIMRAIVAFHGAEKGYMALFD